MKNNKKLTLIITLVILMSAITFLVTKINSKDQSNLPSNELPTGSGPYINPITTNLDSLDEVNREGSYQPREPLLFKPTINNQYVIQGKTNTVIVNDFRLNQDVELFDPTTESYYLANNQTSFHIVFSGFDQNFQIIAKSGNATDTLTGAMRYLKETLGLESVSDVCKLKTTTSLAPEMNKSRYYEQVTLPGC